MSYFWWFCHTYNCHKKPDFINPVWDGGNTPRKRENSAKSRKVGMSAWWSDTLQWLHGLWMYYQDQESGDIWLHTGCPSAPRLISAVAHCESSQISTISYCESHINCTVLQIIRNIILWIIYQLYRIVNHKKYQLYRIVLSELPETTSRSRYWRHAIPRLCPFRVRINSLVTVLQTLIVRSPDAETMYLSSKSTTLTAARWPTRTRRNVMSIADCMSHTAIERSCTYSRILIN